jgi:hypothetical protein
MHGALRLCAARHRGLALRGGPVGGGRHAWYQLATARVPPPALGQWHTIRVGAVGKHIQAYLNGALLLEHRDARYGAGQIGL